MKPKNRKSIKTHYQKCRSTGKSILPTEKDASRVMMRIWSHDTKADIRDLHTYKCDHCGGWHVGHRSYYEMALKKSEQTSVSA